MPQCVVNHMPHLDGLASPTKAPNTSNKKAPFKHLAHIQALSCIVGKCQFSKSKWSAWLI